MNFYNSHVPVQVDLHHELDYVSISLIGGSFLSPIQLPTYISVQFLADFQPSPVQVPCALAPAFANMSCG
jgi:hypothetical protein